MRKGLLIVSLSLIAFACVQGVQLAYLVSSLSIESDRAIEYAELSGLLEAKGKAEGVDQLVERMSSPDFLLASGIYQNYVDEHPTYSGYLILEGALYAEEVRRHGQEANIDGYNPLVQYYLRLKRGEAPTYSAVGLLYALSSQGDVLLNEALVGEIESYLFRHENISLTAYSLYLVKKGIKRNEGEPG